MNVPAEAPLAALSVFGYAAPARRATGARPELKWIAIAALVVDRRYQREIGRHGRAQIARIAASFDWAYFTPVVVAPVAPGGFFAIIDGQHRTTAAKLIGEREVPCAVVRLDLARQALSFGAINGAITRLHSQQMHRSAVVAGQPRALAIEAAAREGGARICASPTTLRLMPPGDTNSIGSLGACLDRFGHETLVAALLAITGAGRATVGLIDRDTLPALCEVMAAAADRAATVERLRGVDLRQALRDAAKARGESKGRLAPHLRAVLDRRLGRATAAPQPIFAAPRPTPAPAAPRAPSAALQPASTRPAHIGLSPAARIIDHRVGGFVDLGEPPPGRSALDQRNLAAAGRGVSLGKGGRK